MFRRPLGVRLDEHRKNVKERRSKISKIAEHVWEEYHKVLCDNVEIVGKESNMLKRKIVEASWLKITVSQASKVIPTIWYRNIPRYVERKKK